MTAQPAVYLDASPEWNVLQKVKKVRRLVSLKRDYYAGALMMLLGLIVAHEGSTYPIGTLYQMGPGYFPLALGVLLAFLGALIALNAIKSPESEQHFDMPKAEWRGWFCIIAGPVLFIILGRWTGMLPATFACVFVAALGDRETTLRGAVILASCVTIFGVLLFHYLLQLPMPVLSWGGT